MPIAVGASAKRVRPRPNASVDRRPSAAITTRAAMRSPRRASRTPVTRKPVSLSPSRTRTAGMNSTPAAMAASTSARVEIPAGNRGTGEAMRIVAGHPGTPWTGDDHSGDRNRVRADAIPEPEAVENRQRSWIQRVAAQLVAGKIRAIDQTDMHARTRQDQRRHGARRSRAHDERWRHRTRPSHQRAVLGSEPETVAEGGVDVRFAGGIAG